MLRLHVSSVLITLLIMSFNVEANPLEDLSWVKGQVISVINNKHSKWRPTDFALARGDSISSVSNIQITKDVISKTGYKLPNIINDILIWIR